MSNEQSIGDRREYVLTEAGYEAIRNHQSCEHIVRRQDDFFYCRSCGQTWKLTRRTFGAAGRDNKHD